MYLDPGSGSILIQIILGSIFAIGVGLKLFWSRIKGLVSKKPPEPPSDEPYA